MTDVWAHRGASGTAPENTLPAFELAVQEGADGIEIDVHLTADGEVVVIHDETLDRTCGVPGRVADLPASEVTAPPATNGRPGYPGARVPLLTEVLDLVEATGITVNIELKSNQPALPDAVHRLVQQRGMAAAVVYSAFNHFHLVALKELGTAALLAPLLSQPLVDVWDYAARNGFGAIHPPLQLLAIPGLVTQCHRLGITVNVWTPNTPSAWETARALGVDAVITNYPAAARACLR